MYTTLHILPIYVYRIIIYNTYGTILSILLYFYTFNCSKKKMFIKMLHNVLVDGIFYS